MKKNPALVLLTSCAIGWIYFAYLLYVAVAFHLCESNCDCGMLSPQLSRSTEEEEQDRAIRVMVLECMSKEDKAVMFARGG
jgi:hypothetical protein